MSISVFSDKSAVPDIEMVAAATESEGNVWNSIHEYISGEYEGISYDWKYYSEKTGWILQVLLNSKPFFLVTPMRRALRISFIYSNKACNEILKGDFPEEVKRTLASSPRHTEGRSLRVDITSQEALNMVKQLIHIRRFF